MLHREGLIKGLVGLMPEISVKRGSRRVLIRSDIFK